MPNNDYRNYLTSEDWATKRQLIMVRALGCCEIDGCRRRADHVHHLTYKRIFHEELEDLLAICAIHHRQLHCPPSTKPMPVKVFKSIPAQLDLFAANDNKPQKLPATGGRSSSG